MKILVFFMVFIFYTVTVLAQWNNPENQMLTDSMNSFFYYAHKDVIPFSDPNSLIDTNRRSKILDDYHDQSDYELQISSMRQQKYRQLYNPNKPYSYNPNYKLHYLHSKKLK